MLTLTVLYVDENTVDVQNLVLVHKSKTIFLDTSMQSLIYGSISDPSIVGSCKQNTVSRV